MSDQLTGRNPPPPQGLRCLLLILSVLGLLLWAGAEAFANPLTGKSDPGVEETAPPANPLTGRAVPAPASQGWAADGGIFTGIWDWVRDTQRWINNEIAIYMADLAIDPSPAAIGFGLVLAFLYGAFHTVGPGHGKIVVISYFLSHPASVGRSLAMGSKIAFTHVISAIVLVTVADITIRVLIGGSPAEIEGIRIASYAIIAVIGIWMFVRTLRKVLASRASAFGHDYHGHDHSHHGHGHAHCCHLDHFDEKTAKRDQTVLSIAAGLVPCTGALLIMLFALANDLLLIGILLVVGISIGMAGAVSLIGMACIVARSLMTKVVNADSTTGGRVAMVLEFAGAIAITAVGVLFTAAAYQAA